MNTEENIFDLLDDLERSDVPYELATRKIHYFLQKRARETGTPYHGHFELTPLCNLNCKMCYVHLQEDQMGARRLLTTEEWIGLIQQSINAGMLKASLSGGECLTYPGFDDIYLFLKTKGIATSILSNGVLLDQKRIEFFNKNRPDSIQISLYGSTEDAYEKVTGKRVFSIVFNNIVAAKKAQLPIKIAITPNRYMLDDVRDTIKLAKEFDLPYAINIGLLTPRCETGRLKREYDITLDDYIDIFLYNRMLNDNNPIPQETIPLVRKEMGYKTTGTKCGAGRSVFSVTWDGIMKPCSQMDTVFASPLRDGFVKAWDSIKKEISLFPAFTECENCKYSDVCSFCAAENEKMGSRYKLNSEWCEKTWKMVEHGLRVIKPECE